MGKKSVNNKKYIQAVRYYEEGQIDKALKKCEESISENLKNSSTLNLKGLLLYLKGDLRGAVATWKINADFNDNDIAKNYIQDSKADSSKINLYKEGEVLLARQNVNAALSKFKQCKESDFNAIKVNLSLAVCYLKKGEYEYAAAHLTRVLNIDRNNKTAKKIAKELQKVSDVKLQSLKGIDITAILKVAVAAAVLAGLIFGIYAGGTSIYKYFNDSTISNNEKDVDESSQDNIDSDKGNNLEENEKANNEIIVDTDKIQNLIDTKNYNELFNELDNIDINKLDGKKLAVCKLGIELLENEGAQHFYNEGMSFYKQSDYKNAMQDLEKAYKYSSKTYLASEILFFDAASNDKNKNIDRAIKLYEEYYNKYKSGDYLDETLYNLAMIYKSQDLVKAKSYAKELNENHSDSMYNNENIKSLLNN